MTSNSRFHLFLLLISFVLLLSLESCNGYKDLPYLKYTDQTSTPNLMTDPVVHEPTIMPNDIISITVNSEEPGITADFNLPIVPLTTNEIVQTTLSGATALSGSLQNYIVDKNGQINFPVLGELKIGGMTAKEAQDYIASLIYPRYIAVKPIVNIRFLNFEVSVMGEVTRPGIYSSKNGQMSILDAIAAAGDLTIFGKRNNVMIVRTAEDGRVSTYSVDLQNKDMVMNKDIFYLQQNDKIIVEANKARGNSSRFGTFEAISLSALSIIISIIVIIVK